jgi:hypothetical protein
MVEGVVVPDPKGVEDRLPSGLMETDSSESSESEGI